MRFLRYVLSQALFMIVLGAWIGVLWSLLWLVHRSTDSIALTLAASSLVLIVATSALTYSLSSTQRGQRITTWWMRLAFPEHERW